MDDNSPPDTDMKSQFEESVRRYTQHLMEESLAVQRRTKEKAKFTLLQGSRTVDTLEWKLSVEASHARQCTAGEKQTKLQLIITK